MPEQVKDLVQGYPTVILFPSGQGTPEPVMYQGVRDRDAVAAWLEENAPTIQSTKALRGKIRVGLPCPGRGWLRGVQKTRIE